MENQLLLALLGLTPGHHPALWPSTTFCLLPSQGPPLPQGCCHAHPPTITDYPTQLGLFSIFLHVELLRPGRHLTICCHLLFWGFSLAKTLVSLTRQWVLLSPVLSLLLPGVDWKGSVNARMTVWRCLQAELCSPGRLNCCVASKWIVLIPDSELLLEESLPGALQLSILRTQMNEYSITPLLQVSD